MTHFDVVCLAVILKTNRENLTAEEMTVDGFTSAVPFSKLLAHVRNYCRNRFPEFDDTEFTNIVFGRIAEPEFD